jgi:hypothetical protein
LHGSVGAILEARALHQDHQPTPPPFTPIRPPPPPSTSIPPPLPAPNRTPTTSIPPPPFTLNQTRPPPSTSIRPPPSEPNRARPRAPVGLYQHHPLPGTYDLINEERLSSKRGFQDGAGWGRPDEADEEERSSKRSRYREYISEFSTVSIVLTQSPICLRRSYVMERLLLFLSFEFLCCCRVVVVLWAFG